MIPSHKLAQTLLGFIDKCLDRIGLDKTPRLEEVIYLLIIVAVALLIGWVLRKIILWSLRRWVKLRNTAWGRDLLKAHTLSTSCHIIPPIVLLICLPIAFRITDGWHVWAMRLTIVYMLITLGMAICAAFKYIWIRYDAHENQKRLPLKGIYEVAIGIVWIIIAIIAVSVLINKSPAILLGGLGAFAAALMLVFRDSILGFVAGIQMSNNDMLHVGDWITVPGTLADGVVTDVTISVVKVLNFDNTTVMLPPYTLVSTSFQNWRSMGESKMRRFCRNILIDVSSIKPDKDDPTTTNLDKYRKFCFDYMNKHPKLNHTTGSNALTMVRLLAGDANGIPMQLYGFTDTTVWPDYEEIQSEVAAYCIAAATQFGLIAYNYPSNLSGN
ncbi:MAG: mechanosensitive ion channel family protein [Bacteroides sp.]|nr:mechanosensitive ion channel family protein [Bacteroides sp.]MCM1379928.1 mechanosensitive ion channel family protein [Bacteroides sp.]MCM1446217.1 mechanosensitive ion channel family protein [Prevotella sp.]